MRTRQGLLMCISGIVVAINGILGLGIKVGDIL